MKTVIKKISLISLVILSAIISIPTVFAQKSQDCNRFWAKCNVDGVNVIRTDDDTPNAALLDTIKNAINWILWFLATIVLCFCMYWWFKMILSWGNSKWYDDWWKVLKNALLWLAIILLAWMIVSVVFWFVGTLSGWNQTRIGNVT